METLNKSKQQQSSEDGNPLSICEEDEACEGAKEKKRCLGKYYALNLTIIKRGPKFKINHEVVFLDKSSSSSSEPDECDIVNEKFLGPSHVGIEFIDLTGEKNSKLPSTVGIQFIDSTAEESQMDIVKV